LQRQSHLYISEDGDHALRFFDQLVAEEHGTPPDLLLLDLNLPGVSGSAVLQRLKAFPVCARMRIVVMTAVDDLSTRMEASRLGADAFFVKPTGFHLYIQLGESITALASRNTEGIW